MYIYGSGQPYKYSDVTLPYKVPCPISTEACNTHAHTHSFPCFFVSLEAASKVHFPSNVLLKLTISLCLVSRHLSAPQEKLQQQHHSLQNSFILLDFRRALLRHSYLRHRHLCYFFLPLCPLKGTKEQGQPRLRHRHLCYCLPFSFSSLR